MPDAAQHREIRKRYARKQPPSLGALRIKDLSRLFRARYGTEQPDDDDGRDNVRIMAHHLAMLAGDPRRRVTSWVQMHAPWLSIRELDRLLAEVVTRPRRWKAQRLAWRLRLTEADRKTLQITTIGSIDVGTADRLKARQERNRIAKLLARRAKGVKPRAQYLATSINAAKPWQTAGISRATWYRRTRR